MSFLEALLFSAVQGLAGILPLSATGHRAAVEIWSGSSTGSAELTLLGQLGCLAAVVTLGRARLAAAAREAIGRLRTPQLLLASPAGRDAATIGGAGLLAVAFYLLFEPLVRPVAQAPLLAGVGLLLTATALLSTVLAPAARRVGPNLTGILALGLAQGLAAIPGLSPVAAGYAVLSWLGIKAWPAAQLALLSTTPVLAMKIARRAWTTSNWDQLSLATGAVCLLAAMATAAAAAVVWRALCAAKKDRTALLDIWLVPLALAMLAYGYALDQSFSGPV